MHWNRIWYLFFSNSIEYFWTSEIFCVMSSVFFHCPAAILNWVTIATGSFSCCFSFVKISFLLLYQQFRTITDLPPAGAEVRSSRTTQLLFFSSSGHSLNTCSFRSHVEVSARHQCLQFDVQKPTQGISVGFQGSCTMPHTDISSHYVTFLIIFSC